MKKCNKEQLRLALKEYREACHRMQVEQERCMEIEAGEYDESKRPDPDAWYYWVSAMESLETTVESVLFDE